MSRLSNRTVAVAGAFWLVALVCGIGWFISYQNTASAGAAAPARWPAETKLPRAEKMATLVLFLHPGCPCSRVSLDELADLQAASDVAFAVRVVWVRPPDWKEEIERDRIPGAPDFFDDGTEVRHFGALTSGQVLLYDRDGVLRFSGGVTRGRGEHGESAGRLRLRAILEGRAPDADGAKVFGCALLGPT